MVCHVMHIIRELRNRIDKPAASITPCAVDIYYYPFEFPLIARRPVVTADDTVSNKGLPSRHMSTSRHEE